MTSRSGAWSLRREGDSRRTWSVSSTWSRSVTSVRRAFRQGAARRRRARPWRAHVARRLFGAISSGRYEVRGRVGAGGMGEVMVARDRWLERDVALKVPLAQEDGAWMTHEARALARVRHEGVVSVFDRADLHGNPCLVMELVDGQRLDAWAAEGPDWAEVVAVVVDVARGLASVHAEGLVHRDVKPHNVVVDTRGRGRLIDFGLAREAASSSGGATAGTPRYMAPEQRGGAAPSPAADQYALCVTALEALADATGSVPRRVHRVLRRGLRTSCSRRYSSMDAVADALERAAGGTQGGRRRRLLVVLAGAMALGLLSVAAPTPASEADHCAEFSTLTEAWRTDRLQAIESQVQAGAEQAWRRFVEGGTSHAAAWTAALQQACDAMAEGDTDGWSTRGCLLDQGHRIVEVLEVLDREPRVTPGVLALVPHPRSATHCLDGEQAQAYRHAVDPWTDARVEPLEARYQEHYVREQLGRGGEQLAGLQELVAESHAVDHPPLEARARMLLAESWRHRGQWAEAYRELGVAHDVAAAADDASTMFWAASMSARLAREHLRDPEQSDAWVRHAEAALERLGHPPMLVVKLLEMRAVLAGLDQQWVTCARLLARAVAEAVAHPDRVAPHDMAIVRTNRARALRRAHQTRAAARELEVARAMLRAELGEHHPFSIEAEVEQLAIWLDLEAYERVRQASVERPGFVAMVMALHGGDTGSVPGAMLESEGRPEPWWALGRVELLDRQDRSEEAEALLAQVASRVDREQDPEAWIYLRFSQARLAERRGHDREALDFARQAARERRRLDRYGPWLARTMVMTAGLALRVGEREEAQYWLDEAEVRLGALPGMTVTRREARAWAAALAGASATPDGRARVRALLRPIRSLRPVAWRTARRL